MKWSVALFGHYKPEYHIVEIGEFTQIVDGRTIVHTTRPVAFVLKDEFVEYENHYRSGDFIYSKENHVLKAVGGNEFRARPGDIIAYKPQNIWSENERREFLIVTIDGLSEGQMEALCEAYFDPASYDAFNPDTIEEYLRKVKAKMLLHPGVTPNNIELRFAMMDHEELYKRYIRGKLERCAFPMRKHRKRRFNIPLSILESKGVDTTIMLNRGVAYSPDVIINRYDCYDEMKGRFVDVSDNLRPIQPRTEIVMEAAKYGLL